MNAREQRGQTIADTLVLSKMGEEWVVPSQTGKGVYIVGKDQFGNARCQCPDFFDTGMPCKHVYAVQFKVSRAVTVDGTVTETKTLTVTKKTYPQDWVAYNKAQTNERRHFHQLLHALCETIPVPSAKPNPKGGRPALPIRDAIFGACLKVYCLMSARRFNGELEESHTNGFIGCVPHFNYALHILNKHDVAPILKGMIEIAALPLRAVETKFATDSTGFATTTYGRWFDHKYGVERTEAKWVKAHFTTGVLTNVVTTVNIDHQDAADAPQFAPLTNRTAELGFTIKEMSADKAYPSVANFEAVEAAGGTFFPMFKSNATGAVGGAYEKAFHYFSFKRDEYLEKYHLRSNVESTVSMIKRKFGHAVKAKNDVAQKNETYCKFVCHNICVLVAEMYAMGIDPTFKPVTTCTNTEEPARLPSH